MLKELLEQESAQNHNAQNANLKISPITKIKNAVETAELHH